MEKISDAIEDEQDGSFLFTRTGDFTQSLTVYIDVSGTALEGIDFQTVPTSVTFDADSEFATLTISPIDDADMEPVENVTLTVLPGITYDVGSPSVASLDVFDNDTPIVGVERVLDAGETGARGLVRFTRTGDLSQQLIANFTVGGTATSGLDYQSLALSVTFAPNVREVEVPVTALNDNLAEGTEVLRVTVTEGSGYTTRDYAVAEVNIADDEGAPGVIAGTVWKDFKGNGDGSGGSKAPSSGNGIQNKGEFGYAHDTVNLLDENGNIVLMTVTDANGNYRFDGLALDTPYSVKFGQPLLMNFTQQNKGTDPSKASQADASGNVGPIALTVNVFSAVVNAGLLWQLPPIKPMKYDLHFADKDGKILKPDGAGQWLHVAKWNDAFEPTPGNNTAPRIKGPDANQHDFIDRDNDRFYVRVYDPIKWGAMTAGKPDNPSIIATLETYSGENPAYDDDATQISLARMTSPGWEGWYISDSQMLVSNETDDTYFNAHIEEDERSPGTAVNAKDGYNFAVSDRTHRTTLGGRVELRYKPTDITYVTTTPVRYEKILKLHLTILTKPSGAPYLDADDANKSIAEMRETYAQAGIRILLVDDDGKVINAIGNGQMKPPPGKVKLAQDGLDEYNGPLVNGKLPMTMEEQELLGHAQYRAKTPPNSKAAIEVYYVNFLSRRSLGEAFPASLVPDAKYANSVVVEGGIHLYQVLSHECMHDLLDASGHEGGELNPTAVERTNLLVNSAFSIRTGSQVFDSRRMTLAQVQAMFTAGVNLLDPNVPVQ